MELRHIRYFAAIAREGNISRAAKALGISQPALSKQLGELETELGQTLIARGTRPVQLTAKGLLLKHRADEILSLVDCTAREVSCAESKLSGRISIGAGETFAFSFVAAALRDLIAQNPAVSFRIVSGNAEDLSARVRRGDLDLAVLIGPGRIDGCDNLSLGAYHRLGLVIARDDPLARKKGIVPADLLGRPLLMPRRMRVSSEIAGWAGYDYAKLNVVGTFNLLYNAAHAVAEGVGAAVSIDGVIPEMLAKRLVFRPFEPELYSEVYLAWKEHAELAPAAAELVRLLRGRVKECADINDFNSTVVSSTRRHRGTKREGGKS